MLVESLFEFEMMYDYMSSTQCWFLPYRYNEFTVYEKRPDGSLSNAGNRTIEDLKTSAYAEEFNKYLNRPESLLAQRSSIEAIIKQPIETKYQIYLQWLIGAIYAKDFRLHVAKNLKWTEWNTTKSKQQLIRCITWLNSTDFSSAPASTIFHDNEVSGLLQHSMQVAIEGIQLLSCPKFSTCFLEDVVLCGLVHDWCKIGMYESYKKNVKQGNNWVQEDAFRVVDVPLTCYGHGVSSLILISRFFSLQPHLELAIRWHQGRWYCSDAERYELQQANNQYPLVLLIQFADQLAITKY